MQLGRIYEIKQSILEMLAEQNTQNKAELSGIKDLLKTVTKAQGDLAGRLEQIESESAKIKEYDKKQGGGKSSPAPDRRFYLHDASKVPKENISGTEDSSDRNGGLYCHHAAPRHSHVGESMPVNGMRTKESAVRNKETEHNTISVEGLGLEKESANAALRDQEPVKSSKAYQIGKILQRNLRIESSKDFTFGQEYQGLEEHELEASPVDLNNNKFPSAPYRNIGTVQLGIANKDKEEGTMFLMKDHEDFKNSDEETLMKEDESCNGSRDENYDVKLRAKQPSAVFENEMKSVKQKDESLVDPIEEVADTTTKPVKYEEQVDWIDPKVENMMRNKIKDYDQRQKNEENHETPHRIRRSKTETTNFEQENKKTITNNEEEI